eukprot:TRINITY_DN3684_c0_g1_i1.p2 TRINITY_DN3684_c0_g1~~TRINITY_DN3684_c0_g1_i1.p2  ORF type:complete len:112 (+),score=28.17 TRINITY_DN3684_c0_g1_i1:38-337(+)
MDNPEFVKKLRHAGIEDKVVRVFTDLLDSKERPKDSVEFYTKYFSYFCGVEIPEVIEKNKNLKEERDQFLAEIQNLEAEKLKEPTPQTTTTTTAPTATT